MKVRDVLARHAPRVVATTPETSVQEIADLMARERIGAVMVRNWEGVIIGIFSERDIVNGLSAHRDRLLEMEVGEVMTSKVMSCRLDDDIMDVIKMMTERRFRHMPVIEDRKIEGIISLRDLVEYRIVTVVD